MAYYKNEQVYCTLGLKVLKDIITYKPKEFELFNLI